LPDTIGCLGEKNIAEGFSSGQSIVAVTMVSGWYVQIKNAILYSKACWEN